MIEPQFIIDPDGRIIQRVGWRRLESVKKAESERKEGKND